jgi:alkylated DNA nucleotide flippase Atl1
MRAVGAANGRNPISIITPCHRVIGSNGKLTGFGGGLEAKAYLLALEGTPAHGSLEEKFPCAVAAVESGALATRTIGRS